VAIVIWGGTWPSAKSIAGGVLSIAAVYLVNGRTA
jgi:hypothetical protein